MQYEVIVATLNTAYGFRMQTFNILGVAPF